MGGKGADRVGAPHRVPDHGHHRHPRRAQNCRAGRSVKSPHPTTGDRISLKSVSKRFRKRVEVMPLLLPDHWAEPAPTVLSSYSRSYSSSSQSACKISGEAGRQAGRCLLGPETQGSAVIAQLKRPTNSLVGDGAAGDACGGQRRRPLPHHCPGKRRLLGRVAGCA